MFRRGRPVDLVGVIFLGHKVLRKTAFFSYLPPNVFTIDCRYTGNFHRWQPPLALPRRGHRTEEPLFT